MQPIANGYVSSDRKIRKQSGRPWPSVRRQDWPLCKNPKPGTFSSKPEPRKTHESLNGNLIFFWAIWIYLDPAKSGHFVTYHPWTVPCCACCEGLSPFWERHHPHICCHQPWLRWGWSRVERCPEHRPVWGLHVLKQFLAADVKCTYCVWIVTDTPEISRVYKKN